MMTYDMSRPEGRVAQLFMERKGLGHLQPNDVDKLDGQPCWYFYYALPEGDLELEIFWNQDKQSWETLVTTFTLAS